MSLTRVPRTPFVHRRLIHHLSLTRTSSSPQPSSSGELFLSRAKSVSHIQMAPLGASRNTLAGASLVALGAGALLYARAYSSSTSSRSSTSTSTGSKSQGASSPTKTGGSRSISTSNDAASETSSKQEQQQQVGAPAAPGPEAPAGSAAGGPKQPCGGCDCGLMEPGPLEGTMHAYERHVIICSGHEDWPKVVEAEESSLAESLFNMCLGAGLIFTKKVALAAKKAGAPKNRQVKISACSEPSRGPDGTTDVIVYPEGLIYSLSRENASSLEQFVRVQLMDGQVATELQPIPVSYKKMVLVCTHMSRDKRCGRAGPQVVGEMRKALAERGVGPEEIAVRGSSHFGGHKYAGVLIIYPQGDWFGLVSKRNAPAIVDKCVLGSEGMKANWRGNMANPGTKAEPPADKPKPTAAAAVAAAPIAARKKDPESSQPAAVNGAGVAGRPRRESIDGA